MSWNYILIDMDANGRGAKYEIKGMYESRVDAIQAANSDIKKFFLEQPSKKDADRMFFHRNDNCNDKNKYALVYYDRNNTLTFTPLNWDELSIQGIDGQTYIDNLKLEYEKDQDQHYDRNNLSKTDVKIWTDAFDEGIKSYRKKNSNQSNETEEPYEEAYEEAYATSFADAYLQSYKKSSKILAKLIKNKKKWNISD